MTHKETWLKYPGGKAKLAPRVVELLGSTGPYVEPCVGGGAVLRLLVDRAPPPVGCAILADANPAVRLVYADLLDESRLRTFARVELLSLRASLNDWLRSPMLRAYASMQRDVAAAFFAYNRRCMNGIVRVNQGGEFNVAEGKGHKGKPPQLTDAQCASAVRASRAIRALRPVVLDDCVTAIDRAPSQSRIYLDTPYSGGFVAYAADGWSTDDDIRAYEAAGRAVRNRDCRLVASAPDTEWYRDVVRQTLPSASIESVTEARNVNSDGAGRKAVPALLISAGSLR